MKLTKYDHSCLVLEEQGSNLVIDPGNLSGDFLAPDNVTAVVLTHAHEDHIDVAKIQQILVTSPEAIVLSTTDVARLHPSIPIKIVQAGQKVSVGPFRLEFSGGQHATIHPSIKTPENLTVLVNDSLYYPGDSLVPPIVPISTLLVPVAAPWLKISEVIDFIQQAPARLVIPTHDAILSEPGKLIIDKMLKNTTRSYQRLKSGDSIDI